MLANCNQSKIEIVLEMIAILIIIIGIQIFIFSNIIKKIGVFKNVFNTFYELKHDVNGEQSIVYNVKKSTSIFRTVAECINSYLRNNGSRANDYHLMQDIVERNCDSNEEEIHSQIPTTLYLGLVGTMFGIIFGLHGLDLSKMFGGELETQTVTNLLNDVSTAMIASVCGIIFTTVLTFVFKNAKAKNASDKNLFLSWIQANMLPTMSSDVNVALDKMSTALSEFNSQFADNTQKLNSTLSLVSETSQSQAELYNTIKNLQVKEMATANVKVFKALSGSAEQIENLAYMLQASKNYLDSVRELNDKLDKNEQRTKLIEDLGNFFKEELSAVEQRKKMFLETIDEIDKKHEGEFNKIVGSFESKAENAIQEISTKFESQNNELRKLAAKQEDIIKGSDFSSMPLKMNTLNEKITHLEQFVDKTQGNIIGAVSKIKVEPPVAPTPIESKTNYVSVCLWALLVILSQIISAKMDYSVAKSIIFNLFFWTGIIGVIVTLVKGKK